MSSKRPSIAPFEQIGAPANRVVQRLLPDGVLRGNEFIARNPTRNDHSLGSFSYNTETGLWADFATGDAGQGVISLCAYLDKSSYRDAWVKIKRLSGECDFQIRPCSGVKVAKTANIQANKLIEYLWRESCPAAGTKVEKYLSTRGLDCPIPDSIRYHPRCKHAESGLYLSAMIAAVTIWPSNKIVALHRTFLNADGTGKADVKPNKKMLGSVRGGALRLAVPTDRLIVAEGIETAMSLWIATGMPTWAALSATGYGNLSLPDLPLAGEIIIGADPDEAGLLMARRAAEKWSDQGRKVLIAVPDHGEDFNDMLRRK